LTRLQATSRPLPPADKLAVSDFRSKIGTDLEDFGAAAIPAAFRGA